MTGRRYTAAQQERERLRQTREQERALKAAQREQVLLAKERLRLQKEHIVQVGEAETARRNNELQSRWAILEHVLQSGLERDSTVSFESLKERNSFPPLFVPSRLAKPSSRPVESAYLPSGPSFLAKVFTGKKYERDLAEGRARFEAAEVEWQATEEARVVERGRLQTEHDAQERAHEERQRQQQQGVDELSAAYSAGNPDPIRSYCELVLARSPYPDNFPASFRVAYVPDSRQVVVDYELPSFAVVPEEAEFRYIKARDEITATSAKAADRRTLYTRVVSSVTVRTMHELLSADVGGYIDVVAFSGYVCTIDPGTGIDVRPYLITLRASRDEMAQINLNRVDPMECLRHLKAQVSRSPTELLPVRPIVDFNMVDPRFIEHGDVLGQLDQRPNLMEVTPGEFETLVTNLFEKMGLETKLTQASRDGGVDCVAYDQRPVLGGKVVVQAKRYKNTVGVSAVRDLFGTMHNEGANKGILVTTSDYGKAAFDFANGKPIELINGHGLLYLLQEQGVDAKIEMPDDWQDPETES